MLESAQHGWEFVLRRRALLMRSGKFLVVGGLGTLVNTVALVILYQQLHLALVASSALATELAIGHNYVWNDYWTFGRLGGVHYVAANLVGVGLALIWNFTVNVCWTWGSS